MKKVIGLVPLYDEYKDSYWMLPGYMKSLEMCGAVPVMLPLTTDTDELRKCLDICDGLLLTGGHDVDPSVYGELPTDECGTPCRERDIMEAFLLRESIAADKPVLGICRGIQFMNACLGGNLYQDLPTEHPSETEHHMSMPYDREVHQVEVLDNTLLADIIGPGYHGVNSYHHQAIKTLADSLDIMAVSEDGLVEAVSVRDKKFIVGVQWHPEFSYLTSSDSIKIIQAFVDVC